MFVVGGSDIAFPTVWPQKGVLGEYKRQAALRNPLIFKPFYSLGSFTVERTQDPRG